jgi:hypothetical protein
MSILHGNQPTIKETLILILIFFQHIKMLLIIKIHGLSAILMTSKVFQENVNQAVKQQDSGLTADLLLGVSCMDVVKISEPYP